MNGLINDHRRRQRSSALVLTLLAMVLITGAVLVFFSSVTSNREIEDSRTHAAESDQLVRSAGDYVASQLLQEIVNPANSDASSVPGLFVPKVSINSVPIRTVNNAVLTDPKFFTLIRQSILAADPNASADDTSVSSRTGRTVGAARWNAPMLVPGVGFTGSGDLPHWIYLDRTLGPVPVSVSNSGRIIGRFAYNIYDIGGLLNANVAGYSSRILTGGATQKAQLKATLAGADLTVIPNVGQGDVDNLVAFRNPDTGADFNSYTNMAQTASMAGYLQPISTNSLSGVAFTNNYFNSRQDFLRYSRTQNANLTNAAPYLTTFSRTVNAPTWGPQSNYGTVNSVNYDYAKNSTNNSVSFTNRFIPSAVLTGTSISIPHFNDDGTLGAPTLVNPGDPVIQRRFSLAKLAWIAHGGPSQSAAFSGTASPPAAIQACFGLVWDTTPNATGDPNWTSDARWRYVGPTGSTDQSTIETLAQVAQEHREPNFFELLQAGILQGSLGASGHTFPQNHYDNHGYSMTGDAQDEWSHTYQIFRIGLNIIDQTTPDNYPTALECAGRDITELYPAASGLTATTVELWGIKDLPYLNKLVDIHYWPTYPPNGDSSVKPAGPVYNYLTFELWNPHQPSASRVGGPTNFRIRPATGASYKIVYRALQRGTDGKFARDPVTGLYTEADSYPPVGNPSYTLGREYFFSSGGGPGDASNCPLVFTADETSSDAQQSYREPHLIRMPIGNTVFQGDHAYINDPKLTAINLGVFANYCPDIIDQPGPGSGTYEYYFNNTAFSVWDGVFTLEYQDADGSTWRPYTTFVGRPDRPPTGLGSTAGLSIALSANQNQCENQFSKSDPRTFRFDIQANVSSTPQNLPTVDSSWRPQDVNYFSAANGLPNFVTGTFFPGQLASNNPANANVYHDPDTQARWGDGYNQDQNPFRFGDAVKVGDVTARPVVLNRPFQSVAEMGYAFRDAAFKSLDFFTSTSADAGLLDLFSLTDEPGVTAGRVNLGSAPPAVLQALASGGLATNAAGVAADPAQLAADYRTYTRNSDQTPTTKVIHNVGDLPAFMYTGTTGSFGSYYTKKARESAVRTLSSSTQTRTWNVLIDVVAQTGRFPIPTAMTAADFVVEGEKHCWLSVAIDRYTGKIVDQQLEFVDE